MFRKLRAGWSLFTKVCRLLTKRFALKPYVYFVQDAQRGAIYDLNTGKVYSVDSTAAQVLHLAHQGMPPLQIASRIQVPMREIVAFLDSLVVEEVGYWCEGPAGASSDYHDLQSPRPGFHSLSLELTQQCNLRCIHCYADSGPLASSSELQAKDWKQQVGDAATLGCSEIMFTGGEPLVAKGLLWGLITYAAEKGLHITVVTNATLVTRDVIDLFCTFGVRVATSLYGPNEQVHDGITQSPGSFRKLVNNVLDLVTRGVPVGIAMTVMAENQDYVEETEEFVRDRLGAKFVAAPILPVGRGRSNPLASPEGFLRVASDKLLLAAAHGKIQLPVRTEPVFPRVFRDAFARRVRGTCWSGCLCITSSGDVIPCPAARQLVLGNVRHLNLKSIIAQDGVQRLWALSNDHIQVCKDCEYRYACTGCPLWALARGGSLDGKRVLCTYDPYAGAWQADAPAVPAGKATTLWSHPRPDGPCPPISGGDRCGNSGG
mgnify:CR=1 FL=1